MPPELRRVLEAKDLIVDCQPNNQGIQQGVPALGVVIVSRCNPLVGVAGEYGDVSSLLFASNALRSQPQRSFAAWIKSPLAFQKVGVAIRIDVRLQPLVWWQYIIGLLVFVRIRSHN